MHKNSLIMVLLIVLMRGQQAFGLSMQDTQRVVPIVDAFEKIEQPKTQRIKNLLSLDMLLQNLAGKVQQNILPIIQTTQSEVSQRLKQHNTTQDTMERQTLPFPITTQKRIDLHNQARKTPITMSPELMHTAQIRAEHLSQNNIRHNTHRRIQGNYNYNDIENRFAGHGIYFSNVNKTTFSESIAYNTVKCISTDCDQELAQATQKARTFFYDREKKRNGSHYRAIIQENFSNIGIGIAVKNGRYHIVIHYGTPLQNNTDTQIAKT